MIYLLEDDRSIRELVLYTLGSVGMEACGFERPSEFWDAFNKELPQLLLLDIMLPEEDGITILKKIRASESTYHIPVILLTAKSAEYDKVIGLDCGADDYVTKPFGMLELISRIKALLRRSERSQQTSAAGVEELNGLTINRSAHIVLVDGQEIGLTLKEYDLLCLLMSNRGIVHSRDSILRRVWGINYDGENRTVDVHIRTLRAKLGRCGEMIETVRGVGYRIG